MTTLPETMCGVILKGHGGLDQLEFRTDLPVPVPGLGDVLIHVAAAGVNNTDINTRTGWYSKTVSGATDAAARSGYEDAVGEDGSWSGQPLQFPRVQGADCYGEIVAIGEGVKADRMGQKVLVRTMLRAPVAFRPFECWTFGSECDGGFAEYAVAPSADVFAIESDLSPQELGAIPCAYGTAEGMLVRANITGDDRLLVTGASGGVGSALVQLAKLRGAEVTAVASPAKHDALRALGADRVLSRDAILATELDGRAPTVAADLVGGPAFGQLVNSLVRGGRYVTAGAIGGAVTELDLRTLYLNDLSFFGCAAQEDVVFENLVTYLRDNRLRPRIASTFPLKDIHAAQEMFMAKDFVGKIVMVPPQSIC